MRSPRRRNIDPSTMKKKAPGDESQFQSSNPRVSDTKTPTGTDRTSCQTREPIENDEERLEMRQGNMPPPVFERVANPRIRED